MTTITVTTQAELDAALAEHSADEDAEIIIDSPKGVWLKVRATGSARVTAFDSAHVVAYDSASVHATDSARVVAFGSARVHVTGSN